MKFRWFVTSYEPIKLKYFLIEQQVSRSLIKHIKFNEGQFLINDKISYTNQLVKYGDRVSMIVPSEEGNEVVIPSNKKLKIIYEDDHFLIVYKSPNLLTVQSSNNRIDTIVNRVKFYYQQRGYENQLIHVVTRLDSGTEGLVVIAKHRFAHSVLDVALKHNKFEKNYLALVKGKLTKIHGFISDPIMRDPNSFIKRMVSLDGKQSLTEYWLKDHNKNLSLLKIKLHTGRTHQIRVHLSSIGHPLVGDSLYDPNYQELDGEHQKLVCYRVKFFSPFDYKNIECSIMNQDDMLKQVVV